MNTTKRSPEAPVSIGLQHLTFPSLDSTNTLAASYANDPANHGLVVTAESQTAGRGQYQRRWQAPPGSSILMSVLLFPSPPLKRPSLLTAWAAVSVCEAIRQATGMQAQIKWPNDVLIGGKKVCGILCEAGVHHLVAGIGLNARQTAADFEQMGLPEAASLTICSGKSIDVPDLTVRLIGILDAKYDQLARGEIASLEADWKSLIGLLGRTVCAEKMDGSETLGLLRDMAFDGIALELEGLLTVLPPESIRHLRESSRA
jgi:BirA family transcriptional regulator, biotin operon repressor / biotin---[acetyl-CoA-carboxylase] ligase